MATHPSDFAPDESQSHTRASQHHIAGLGELLRSARALQGLALQQVCNETKIPRRYLEALEQDRLEALPGGLYRRAHVRAYAQALHLDPGLALAQLERDLKASVPAVPEPPRKPEAAALTRTPILIRIGLVGAAAYVEQAFRKQALYLNTHARSFTSWPQKRVAAVHRIIQTGSAKISAIPNRLRRRSHN